MFGDEVQTVKVYQTVTEENENDDIEREICKENEERELDSTEVMELIGEIMYARKALSAFDAIRFVLPSVCPKSLLTNEIDEYISMEFFCKDYNLAPLGSTPYLDYPIKLRAIISTIAIARERVRMKEIAEMKGKK